MYIRWSSVGSSCSFVFYDVVRRDVHMSEPHSTRELQKYTQACKNVRLWGYVHVNQWLIHVLVQHAYNKTLVLVLVYCQSAGNSNTNATEQALLQCCQSKSMGNVMADQRCPQCFRLHVVTVMVLCVRDYAGKGDNRLWILLYRLGLGFVLELELVLMISLTRSPVHSGTDRMPILPLLCPSVPIRHPNC